MRNISCIAIDDEPLALTIIRSFCNRKGGMELQTYCEPRIGLEEIIRQKPNFVFLDIQMNSISGLEIANILPKECVFIFTTAHASFALDGFNLDAVDFLHKPFAYERFEKAVDKALRRIEAMESKVQKTQPQETIVVKQEYNNVVIPVDDIIYIEAMENYTKIYRRSSGSYVLSRTSMKSIFNMLPKGLFIRVHKSYIVAKKAILSYSSNQIQLSWKGVCVPIGRTCMEDFLNKLK